MAEGGFDLRRDLWLQIEGDLVPDAWRKAIAAGLAKRPGYAVFSHYVAINGAISAVMGRDEVICLSSFVHASITTLDATERLLLAAHCSVAAEAQNRGSMSPWG